MRTGAFDVLLGTDASAFGPRVGSVRRILELRVAELLCLRVHDVEGIVDAS